MSKYFRRGRFAGLLILLMSFSSCAHNGGCGGASCGPTGCGMNSGLLGGRMRGGCQSDECGQARGRLPRVRRMRGCDVGGSGGLCSGLGGWAWRKPNAVPQTLPLGSTVRAHDQVMQTNGEAADFIFHRHDFVAQTAHLTPDAKDKIVEVAARLRSTPFPVLIERSANNSNPELDALRRNIVATILTDFGNGDAQQRTIVATPYGPGYTGRRAESMYYQHVGFGNNQNNNNGNNGGGFGGGGFGGGGGGF